jgi:hypothetical protein
MWGIIEEAYDLFQIMKGVESDTVMHVGFSSLFLPTAQ